MCSIDKEYAKPGVSKDIRKREKQLQKPKKEGGYGRDLKMTYQSTSTFSPDKAFKIESETISILKRSGKETGMKTGKVNHREPIKASSEEIKKVMELVIKKNNKLQSQKTTKDKRR